MVLGPKTSDTTEKSKNIWNAFKRAMQTPFISKRTLMRNVENIRISMVSFCKSFGFTKNICGNVSDTLEI